MTTPSASWICTECAAAIASSSCAKHPDEVPLNIALEAGRFMLATIEDERRVDAGRALGRKWATWGVVVALLMAAALVVFSSAWFAAIVVFGTVTGLCYVAGRSEGAKRYTPVFMQWVGDINAEPDPEMRSEILHMRATAGTGLERPGGRTQRTGESVVESVVESLLG